MRKAFLQELPLFKQKIHDFVSSTSFDAKTLEYENMLVQTRSALSEQDESSFKAFPELLEAMEQSLQMMQKVVSLHKELDQIFKMNDEELGEFCTYDLNKVEQVVAKGLQEVASLLAQFEIVSQHIRKIIEVLNNPFLSEGS